MAWRVINTFLQTGATNRFGVICDGNDVGASGLTGTPTTASLALHFTGGPFGAEQPCPEGATPADRLAAFLACSVI